MKICTYAIGYKKNLDLCVNISIIHTVKLRILKLQSKLIKNLRYIFNIIFNIDFKRANIFY